MLYAEPFNDTGVGPATLRFRPEFIKKIIKRKLSKSLIDILADKLFFVQTNLTSNTFATFPSTQ